MNRNAMNLIQDTTAFKGSSFNALVILALQTFCGLLAHPIQAQPISASTTQAKPSNIVASNNQPMPAIEVGANNVNAYLPLLKNKRVGIVANPTSTIGKTHLIDTLKALGVNITGVFTPEHGFRGDAENGAHINNDIDPKTGLKIISLYGKHVKPTAEDLKLMDVVVFDIQDVGTRFYTYLTTLHYVMQACADHNKALIVLDRPNPNGFYVDGPVLQLSLKSMVGVHPIPIVHGMTLGELAKMINGEGWLKDSLSPKRKACKLTVVACKNYTHNRIFPLPVPPSPNLPTQNAIYLYPTLCLLEGTIVSMGRGTDKPFECFGAPWLKQGTYTFVPKAIQGKSLNPPYLGDTCHGVLLTNFASEFIISYKHIYIEWLFMLYQECPDKSKFFNPFFDKLAGTPQLKQQIIQGLKPSEIRDSWQLGITQFMQVRKPYLLYPYDPNIGLN
ncbi:MAG: DUF1343 domain-containing protein [Bacteroidetes bacterium]|nr:DUF1343 domain-containing protein [Bacteroidota bacterium]